MKWVVGFVLWAMPLTWLAVAFYSQYLRFLVAVATALLAMVGLVVHVSAIDVLAPMDLALFAALALPSPRTSWGGHLGRLALGLMLLVLIEVVLIVVGIVAFVILAIPQGSPTQLLLTNTTGLLGWVAAPTVWLLLFGAGVFSTWQRGQDHGTGKPSLVAGALRPSPHR